MPTRPLLLAALALSFALPGVAQAADPEPTLLLTSTGELAEDRRFEVQAVGQAGSGADLLVRIREGAETCGSSPADEQGEQALGGRVEGAFSTFQKIGITDPGPYRLCGWLLDEAGDSVLARQTQLLVIRPALAGIGISMSQLAVTGQRIRFTAYGGSELSRLAFFSLRPASLGCAGATLASAAGRFGRVWQIAGPFAATSSFDPLGSPGELLVCGAVIERNADPDPEAAAVAAVTVVDRAQACFNVKRARNSARRKATRTLRRYRRTRSRASLRRHRAQRREVARVEAIVSQLC